MVDEKKIALSPAYQIAALTPKEQGLLLETIDSEQASPSLSQAQRMKKLSQSGELNEDTMLSIMMEQKKPEKNDIMGRVFRNTAGAGKAVPIALAQKAARRIAAYLRAGAGDGQLDALCVHRDQQRSRVVQGHVLWGTV